jgi:hypothetical protein
MQPPDAPRVRPLSRRRRAPRTPRRRRFEAPRAPLPPARPRSGAPGARQRARDRAPRRPFERPRRDRRDRHGDAHDDHARSHARGRGGPGREHRRARADARGETPLPTPGTVPPPRGSHTEPQRSANGSHPRLTRRRHSQDERVPFPSRGDGTRFLLHIASSPASEVLPCDWVPSRTSMGGVFDGDLIEDDIPMGPIPYVAWVVVR